MKKVLIALSLVASFSAGAQQISLACSGIILVNSTFKQFPDLNEKNKKDSLMVNVMVDISNNTMIIDDSYYTANLKYSNLNITNSFYTINHHWANPNKEYAYYSTSMYINRYTGNYEYNYSSLSKDGKIESKHTSNGTCQIGRQWLPKF